MSEELGIQRFSGRGVPPWISAVARRITVFHDSPYLYDGGLAYGQEYRKDLDEEAQPPKFMTFWVKPLCTEGT